MTTTEIEWTHLYDADGTLISKGKTWNPTLGCNRVSPGCRNCYAARDHNRHLSNPKQEDYSDPFNVVKELDHRLDIPHDWKTPRKIFVNSMSDLFHRDISFEFIAKVFEVMHDTPRHQYLILTKRAHRIIDFEHWYLNTHNRETPWTDNIWMGVSVESQDYVERARLLSKSGAKIKFLSCEPLIGPLDLSSVLDGIDQVIAGGESIQGYKHVRHREIDPKWVREIRDQCIDFDTAFFFKQWGNMRDASGKMLSKKDTGRELDGRTWSQYPVKLEVDI